MTEGEAFAHLRETFSAACRQHPDLMEPWIIRLDETASEAEQVAVMRSGLAGTFRQRFPKDRLVKVERFS